MPERPAVSNGVHLYERPAGQDAWSLVRWPLHAWWARFLVVGQCVFRGTRQESLCDIQNTSRFLGWWIRNTPVMIGDAFRRADPQPHNGTAFFGTPTCWP